MIYILIFTAEYWNNSMRTRRGEIKFDWDKLAQKCSKILPQVAHR